MSIRDWQLRLDIGRMKKAVEVAKQKGAIFNSRAAIAQAALESGWWRSLLARKYNNLFGIKAGRGWMGKRVSLQTTEYWGGTYHQVMAEWRTYPSWSVCLTDYAALIVRLWWFADALPHADPPGGDGDALQWLAHLVDRDQPGELAWATGPNYVAKVMRCLEDLEGEGLL